MQDRREARSAEVRQTDLRETEVDGDRLWYVQEASVVR